MPKSVERGLLNVGEKMKIHELCEMFPLVSEEEVRKLVNDIKANGLLEPITIYNNMVIDGRHRLKACEIAGVKPEFVVFRGKEEELLGFVLSKNLIRRHLNESQRAMVAASLANMGAGKPSTSKPAILPVLTTEKASTLLNVSERLVRQAKELKKNNVDISKIVSGEETISEAIKEMKKNQTKEKYKKISSSLLPPTIDLRLGDFRETLKDVETVDLILTDPPYPKEFLSLWDDLGKFANEKLKKNGYLIAYSGQYHLPQVIKSLEKHLDYVWTFCLYHPGKTQIVNGVNVMCRWKPIVIFQKGKTKFSNTPEDYVVSENSEKDLHDWQQGLSAINYLLEKFSIERQTICDPFSGSGTTAYACKSLNRSFVGAEIDKETYKISKGRLV